MAEKLSARERLAARRKTTATKPVPKKPYCVNCGRTECEGGPDCVAPEQKRKLPHHEGCNCARCKKEKSNGTTSNTGSKSGPVDSAPASSGGAQAKRAKGDVPDERKRNTGTAKQADPKPKKRATVKSHPRAKLPVHQDIPIYTPGKDIIFDGLVKVLSTCRDCDELMQVIYPTEYVHPCCEPKPTKVESLATGWLTATVAGDDEAAELTNQEIEAIDTQPPDLKAAALEYVSYGWPVFPLVPKSKEPATTNGFKDATLKENWVRKWWDRNPQYNIGLATGEVFDVLDVDPDKGGAMSFSKLLEDKRIPDTHGVVVTASGGLHMYLKATGKGNRAGWMPGLDYRGKGGYVVAPPSTLGTRGRAWSWLCVPSPTLKQGGF